MLAREAMQQLLAALGPEREVEFRLNTNPRDSGLFFSPGKIGLGFLVARLREGGASGVHVVSETYRIAAVIEDTMNVRAAMTSYARIAGVLVFETSADIFVGKDVNLGWH